MSKRSGGEAVPEEETVTEPQAVKLAVRIGPALAHGVTTVTETDFSLVAAIGELEDEQRVLVPFLECAFYGPPDEDQPLWVGRLALDNVAFLLEQVAVGFLETLDPVASMSHGDVRPLSGRVEYAADRVASAGESLRDAAVKLRALASQKL
jgi:hypothetical protein